MKLIDLLVEKYNSGEFRWPENTEYCYRQQDGVTLFHFASAPMAISGNEEIVFRGQYEEAIKAEPRETPNCRCVQTPVTRHPAHSFLEKGVQHMKDRAAQRDSEDGERSMKACVDAFNAMFGHNMTETQGWQFMVLLKMARSRNKFNPDDYEDGAAYTGLAGEAHSNEQK